MTLSVVFWIGAATAIGLVVVAILAVLMAP